jgi:hypothetical protein
MKGALMSHVVTIQTEVRDPIAAQAACQRLKIPEPSEGVFRLFNSEVTGLGVNLPGWRFPAVFDTQKGQAHYDNFNGRWGEEAELHQFLKMYAAEKVKLEARAKGHTVTEQELADGSLKLTVQVGGVD